MKETLRLVESSVSSLASSVPLVEDVGVLEGEGLRELRREILPVTVQESICLLCFYENCIAELCAYILQGDMQR